MSGGSQQLRQFRIAMRAGATVESAADLAGISMGEARLHVAEDAKNPPPADAFEPLSPTFCAACARHLCGCADTAWRGPAA